VDLREDSKYYLKSPQMNIHFKQSNFPSVSKNLNIKIDKMSFPLTTAYAQFVNAGLINHLNQHGKAVYLPGYIKEGKNDLAAYLKPRLENAFKEQIQRIKEQDDSELFNPPPLEGDEAKEFLQKVLEIAKDNDIVGASSALDSKTCGQPSKFILKII